MSDRDPTNGRFQLGNPGGPGRPRRAIEADYLAALSEAVPLDRWRAIVARAVADAEGGDAKARAWLAGYLAGSPGGDGLVRLAGHEAAGTDPAQEYADAAADAARMSDLFRAIRSTL